MLADEQRVPASVGQRGPARALRFGRHAVDRGLRTRARRDAPPEDVAAGGVDGVDGRQGLARPLLQQVLQRRLAVALERGGGLVEERRIRLLRRRDVLGGGRALAQPDRGRHRDDRRHLREHQEEEELPEQSAQRLFPHELVALAHDGLDPRAAVGHRAELAPDAADVHVDAAVEARERAAQRKLGQRVLADRLPRVPRERLEQVELGAREVERLAGPFRAALSRSRA